MGWSDEALMGNLRRGDMQAFDELYTRHRQPLFNFILRLLQDAALAEDVFQETYMRVLENADRFKPRGKFSTYGFILWPTTCAWTNCAAKTRASQPSKWSSRQLAIPTTICSDEKTKPPPTNYSRPCNPTCAPSSSSASYTITHRKRPRKSSAYPSEPSKAACTTP